MGSSRNLFRQVNLSLFKNHKGYSYNKSVSFYNTCPSHPLITCTYNAVISWLKSVTKRQNFRELLLKLKTPVKSYMTGPLTLNCQRWIFFTSNSLTK